MRLRPLRAPLDALNKRIGAPPRGLRASTEQNGRSGGRRSSVVPDGEAHVWRAEECNRPAQANSSERNWSPATSIGGASTTRCSGGARASGMSVGSPRCRRTGAITAVSSMRAVRVRRPSHRGQASTSRPRLRRISSAQRYLRVWRQSAAWRGSSAGASGSAAASGLSAVPKWTCGRRVGGPCVNRGGLMSPIVLVK